MKKFFVATALVAMLGGLLAGCGGNSASENSTSGNNGKSSEPVKITILNGMVEGVDWLNDQIKTFNAQNPDIKVEQEFQKEATGILKVKIAANQYPDLLLGIGVPQEYLDQDLFHDFSKDSYWDKMVDPSIKNSITDKVRPDKNFGLPFNMMYAGMFYNKQLIEELGIQRPDTWEQFVQALQTIKEKKPDVTPLYFGGKDGWTLGKLVGDFALPRYMQQFGIDEANKLLSNNDPKLGFDEAGGTIETFAKNLMYLKDQGLINKDAVTAMYSSQSEAIATGKAGFVIQGMWALSDILKKNPNPSLGFWPVPSMYSDAKPYLVGTPDGSLMYFEKTNHKEQIQRFIDFLTSSDALKSFSKLRGAPSLYKDGQTDWSILSKDVDQIKQENVAFIASKGPYSPSAYGWDQWGKNVQDLLVGGIKTPADFAKTFKKSWESAAR